MRIEKLEIRAERIDKEKADAITMTEMRIDVAKLKEKTQETSIKGGMIWAVIGVAGTVGLEMLLRFLLHIP
jgi:glutamate/tyrosine decarboxylase-like PLP-dependent enzyme